MTNRQEFIDFILDHYENPRRHGAMDQPHVVMKGGNPGCGDVVTIYVRLDGGERIVDLTFEGEGCTISQAAASILAQRVNKKRMGFDEVNALSYEAMIDLLGQDIVGSRPRCATLALGTLKAAVKRIEMDRRLRAAGRTDEEIRRMREAIAAQAAGSGLVFGEDAVELAKSGATERPPDVLGVG